jgi:hypothetical protein
LLIGFFGYSQLIFVLHQVPESRREEFAREPSFPVVWRNTLLEVNRDFEEHLDVII